MARTDLKPESVTGSTGSAITMLVGLYVIDQLIRFGSTPTRAQPPIWECERQHASPSAPHETEMAAVR